VRIPSESLGALAQPSAPARAARPLRHVATPRGWPRSRSAAGSAGRKVVTKLDVTSRRQLRHALPDSGRDEPMA